jgi:uncharacterized DUF497 family protein
LVNLLVSANKSFEFEWDIGNSSKNVEKHGISTDEVESVFQLKLAATLGHQVSPPVDEERLCIVGPAENGRLASIVFTMRDGRVRPISARRANKMEQKLYEEIRKATQRI